ncbi:CRISPR-associated protein Cas5 [Dehalococcoidia bacterium]|nr:CRISPR-associated protein Cas5 [Dehalococcoidia bacterium]
MKSVPALHVRLEGLTSSFRHPLTISGTQISTPMPSYSTILGIISACAGRVITPIETRIGFEFHCASYDLELERTVRWIVEKGHLKPHPKGQGISRRQVYWYPTLDLYITNVSLEYAFKQPAATPCFGRSQDIAWISFVRNIELYPVSQGALGPTLIPMPQPGVPGLVVRLPEWIENSKMGHTREPGPFGIYQAMIPTIEHRFDIEREDLFHPSDVEQGDYVIYVHRWIK